MMKDVKTLQSKLKRVRAINAKIELMCGICKWHEQGHQLH